MNKIPEFDKRGNIPSGCHVCRINEFKERFVDLFPNSISRVSRFEGYVKYSKFFCENVEGNNRNILNGSFTSNKLNPNDVDFLIVFNLSRRNVEEHKFIEGEFKKQYLANQDRQEMLKRVKNGLEDVNNLHCCDWYPLYQRDPDDELYDDYLDDKEYWLNCWGYTRKDKNEKRHPKGLINVELNSKDLEEIQ